jgi:hypothetical protein
MKCPKVPLCIYFVASELLAVLSGLFVARLPPIDLWKDNCPLCPLSVVLLFAAFYAIR